MADNFTTSLRNRSNSNFPSCRPLFPPSLRGNTASKVCTPFDREQRGSPIEIQWSEEASRRRRAHSKHSAGVIPFVLDSRFLNKSAPFAPRGPLPLPRSGVYTSTPDTVPTLIDNSLLSATNGRKLEIGKLMGEGGGREFFAVFFFWKFTANGYVIQDGEKMIKSRGETIILFCKNERFLSLDYSWITTVEFLINCVEFWCD